MATIIRTDLLDHRLSNSRLPSGAYLAKAGAVAAAIALACVPRSVLAADISEFLEERSEETPSPSYLTIGASVDYTDNVARTASTESADAVVGITSAFEWSSREWSRGRAKAEGDLAYYEYSAGRYSGDITGSALASIDVDLVRDYLRWTVSDSFRQTRITETVAVTPDNRQVANLISTGPRLSLPLGSPRMALIIDGKFQKSSYSVSTEDSEALVGQMSLQRLITSRSALSLNAAARDVSYMNSAFPGYRSRSISLDWDAIGARTSLSLRLGRAQATQQGRDFSKPTGSISLSRQLTEKTTLDLFVDQAVVGAADAIHGSSSSTSASETVGFNTDPFVLKRFGASYILNGTSSFASITGSAERNRYDVSAIDNRNILALSFDFYRLVASRWTVGFFGSLSDEEFVSRNNSKNKLVSYGIAAGFRISGRVQLALSAYHNEQESDFLVSQFDENAVRLALSYDFGRSSGPVRLPRIAR